MGFGGACLLGILIFGVKILITTCRIFAHKIKGDVYKGAVINLKETYKTRTVDRTQNIYIYEVEVNINEENKQIEYKEVVPEENSSNLWVGMNVKMFVDKKTQRFEMMDNLWGTLRTDSLCLIVSFVLLLLILMS
ncbi:MAG: hypothetical protein E7394_00535 [Ruminococcaceae bacterium]|nr:hypothetical protein [Oscillospiraceae bacterium]